MSERKIIVTFVFCILFERNQFFCISSLVQFHLVIERKVYFLWEVLQYWIHNYISIYHRNSPDLENTKITKFDPNFWMYTVKNIFQKLHVIRLPEWKLDVVEIVRHLSFPMCCINKTSIREKRFTVHSKKHI